MGQIVHISYDYKIIMKKSARHLILLSIDISIMDCLQTNYRYHLTLFPPTSQQIVLVLPLFNQTFFLILHTNIEKINFP